MYTRLPAFVLAFHGCDRSVGERILGSTTQHLTPSQNGYDWLGNGIYFWESSPRRALEFALESQRHRHITKGRIRHPFVIGAVIDLGRCLNLLDAAGLEEMRGVYASFRQDADDGKYAMPRNSVRDSAGCFLVRKLDCAVIEGVHAFRQKAWLTPYESVRAALWEGDALYDGAGHLSKNHIQICVRNPRSIKGYFRVREIDGFDVSSWDALGKSFYSHYFHAGRSLSTRSCARAPVPVARKDTVSVRAYAHAARHRTA